MKIDPLNSNPDICQTSIHMLAARCRAWFKRNGIEGELWFADDTSPFPVPAAGLVHVIMFGNFVRRFLESGNWPAEQFKLWVVCEAARDILIQCMRLPVETVGVIPRYELFPPAPSAGERTISFTDNVTFVFAGRISPSKNIEMLLRTVCSMQSELGLNVTLELFGDFDNHNHPDAGRWTAFNYKEHLLAVCAALPWRKVPVWHSKLDPEEWCRRKFENPVLVSFSTFICEDFGVSVAQAQQRGWPALVTDWGGHRDVRGNNVTKVFPGFIGSSIEPAGLIEVKARHLAWIIPHLARSRGSGPGRLNSSPEPIGFAQLDHCRRGFLQSFGAPASLVHMEGLEGFADTKKGMLFFSLYRVLFSGADVPKETWIVLVNDFHNSEDPILGGMNQLCHSVLDQAQKSGKQVLFVPLRDLKAPFCFAQVLAAAKVFVPFSGMEAEALIRDLQNSLPDGISVEHGRTFEPVQ